MSEDTSKGTIDTIINHDTFRFDRETGDIVGPGGAVFTRDDQVFPGAIVLDVEGLNRIYHLGKVSAIAAQSIKSERERERIVDAIACLEEDEPIEPPFPPRPELAVGSQIEEDPDDAA